MLRNFFTRCYPATFLFILAVLCVSARSSAQFVPVTMTGFNQDVVAETGTSSLTTTTMPVDGVGVSNKVMYTVSFRINNEAPGGGLPDNGTIPSAAGNYQLAPYNGNNSLLLQRNQNGDLNLASPAQFSVIRILCLSTEGTSLVNATLYFTDGTTATGVTNYSLSDWFNGSTNLVLSGYGRCTRATPATGFDGFPSNPRFYYIEIPLSCANQQKLLQKINFANVTTAGTNAPYPNFVVMAVSGRPFTQSVSATTTAATCAGNNGSATVTVTGSSSPFSISWNTSPVQTGVTASNLAPGNYTATITNAGGCQVTQNVTVALQNTMAMTVAKTDATCAAGGTITVTASGGSGSYEYSVNGGTSWQTSSLFSNLAAGTYTVLTRVTGNAACSAPSQQVVIAQQNTLSMTVSKTDASCTANGTITVSATGGANYEYSINGGTTWQTSNQFTNVAPGNYSVLVRVPGIAACTTSAQQVTIILNNNLTLSVGNDTTICNGASFPRTVISNGTTFSWTPTAGVSSPASASVVLSPAATTTYTVTSSTANCSLQRSFTVTVFPGAFINAGPDVAIIAGDSYLMRASGATGNYVWTPSTGLSSATVLNPTATPAATTTYTIRVTTGTGCTATDDMTITVLPYCVKPMEAFTPNGDGINDRWLITNGNCLTSASVQVFNRYGSKVYESKDYHNDWDGTYEGKPLPDGTYYYVIGFKLINGVSQVLKGNVTILR